MPALKRIVVTDWFFSILLVAAVVVYTAVSVDFSIVPFEDAAMLMRYADHVAHGYGIVWNIGEPPVDGATDFLFLLTASFLIKSGVAVGRAVRAIGLISHILTILLVYWINRRVHKVNVPLSLFCALYLAVGNGLAYVAAFFGTPFFAMAAAATWALGLMLIQREKTDHWLSIAFAMTGLITGLIRPEGVILVALILLTVILLKGAKDSLSIILIFTAVFLLLGGVYFLWHWDYFGYPLPNPFYKKGGGFLYLDSFRSSLLNTIGLGLPFMPAYILGFRTREFTRQTLAYLIPVLGFAAAFILLSDEMNYGARFQYALLPIMLMSWTPLVMGINWTWLKPVEFREKAVFGMAILAIAAGMIYYSSQRKCFVVPHQLSCSTPYARDGRYEMGKLLAQYRGKGYIIATTEAGLIPYYSGWTAVDAWGLNDAWIAHHGGISAEYLDRYRPHIIMFHEYYSPLAPPRLNETNLSREWFQMTIVMKVYAEDHDYILAAVYGDSPYDTHYYYVRPDFEDSARIVNQIQNIRYYWVTTGNRAINYAGYSQP